MSDVIVKLCEQLGEKMLHLTRREELLSWRECNITHFTERKSVPVETACVDDEVNVEFYVVGSAAKSVQRFVSARCWEFSEETVGEKRWSLIMYVFH